MLPHRFLVTFFLLPAVLTLGDLNCLLPSHGRSLNVFRVLTLSKTSVKLEQSNSLTVVISAEVFGSDWVDVGRWLLAGHVRWGSSIFEYTDTQLTSLQLSSPSHLPPRRAPRCCSCVTCTKEETKELKTFQNLELEIHFILVFFGTSFSPWLFWMVYFFNRHWPPCLSVKTC